jgi:hypothetical protein
MSHHPSEVVPPGVMIDQMIKEQCTWEATYSNRKHFWFLYMKYQIDNCLLPKADLNAGVIPIIDESCSKRAIEDIKEVVDTKTWINETTYDSCYKKQYGFLHP